MTTTAGEEVPFLSAMEREPEKICETTVKVGKKLFALDGMVDRVLGKVRGAMDARGDRGPDPDVPMDDEERILVPVRLLERFGRGGYTEAPKDGKDGLKGIIITCTVTLVSAGIVGVVVLSNNFSALRAEFAEWKQAMAEYRAATNQRLDYLERRP